VVQLNILNSEPADPVRVVRHFPCRIGRARGVDLRFEEPGVWEHHATLLFVPGEGVCIQSAPEALVAVNGQRVERMRLRNGDRLECGSVKLQFWLATVEQGSLWPREACTWLALAALCLLQLWIIHRLTV